MIKMISSLTFKLKDVTANTQIKTFFMHVNNNIRNNINLMRKKIDYVIRQIRLEGIRNYF